MTISFFLTIVLAHAISDYPLQTNDIYAFKLKSIWGIILHVLVFTSTAMMAMTTFGWQLNTTTYLYLVGLTALHIVEDKLKLSMYKGNELFWYITDQAIHICCIALVFILPIQVKAKLWNLGPLINPFLLGAILTIYASYAGSIGIFFYKKTYLNPSETYTRNWQEIIEMMVLTITLILAEHLFIPIFLLLLLMKFALKKITLDNQLSRLSTLAIPSFAALIYHLIL